MQWPPVGRLWLLVNRGLPAGVHYRFQVISRAQQGLAPGPATRVRSAWGWHFAAIGVCSSGRFFPETIAFRLGRRGLQ